MSSNLRLYLPSAMPLIKTLLMKKCVVNLTLVKYSIAIIYLLNQKVTKSSYIIIIEGWPSTFKNTPILSDVLM